MEGLFHRELKPNQREYLSKDNCDCIKGIFAVFVVVSHCRNNMASLNDTILGMVFTAMGYLSVAMFLFISAYGMETKMVQDKEIYIKVFPRNRILYLYVILICSVLFYTIYRDIFFDTVSLKSVLVSMTFGKTIMSYGWYLQAIVVISILFYLLHRLFDSMNIWKILLGTSIYIGLSVVFTSGLLYIQSALAFPLGMTLVHKKSEFEEFCKNHSILSIVLVFIGFSVTLLAGNISIGLDFIMAPCKMASSVFFVLFVITILQKINLNRFSFAKRLGLIYSEIYIMQEVPISFFRSEYIFIRNDLLYLVTTLICVLILAAIVHPFFKWVYKTVRIAA